MIGVGQEHPTPEEWGTLPQREGEPIRLPWRSPSGRYELHRITRLSPAGPTTYRWEDRKLGSFSERPSLPEAMDALCAHVAVARGRLMGYRGNACKVRERLLGWDATWERERQERSP